MDTKQLALHFGNWNRASKALGISRQAISQWVKRGAIPLDRQVDIEVATHGELRADLPEQVRAA